MRIVIPIVIDMDDLLIGDLTADEDYRDERADYDDNDPGEN